MADEVDLANDRIEREISARLRDHHAKAQAGMQKGFPGECELCGEWSRRLVDGACAPCRDKYKLP